MSEIEVGSEWTRKNGFEPERAVVHALFTDSVGRERVMIERIFDGGCFPSFGTRARSAFLKEYGKVEPFFEVGKTYKSKDPDLSGWTWTIVDIRKFGGSKWAIAERKTETWDSIVTLTHFHLFEEV